MKKYLLTTVIIFFASVIALNAQDDQEKKKVHLKIITEENGKVTEIDTVFEGTDKDGMHYFGDIDGKDFNIDSILRHFNIEGHEGMKFITISDKYHSKDSLKHIWHTIDLDMEGNSGKMKKMIYFSEDGDNKLVECKEKMFFISSDSIDAHGEHIFVTSDGGKVKVIKGKSEQSMVWTSDEEGNIKIEDHDGLKVITISEKIHTDDSVKHVWHTYKADLAGDSVNVKKLIYMFEDGDKKLVDCKEDMIFISSDSDGEHGEHMFFHGDGKKVKVVKGKDGESMVWTSKDDGDLKIIKEGNVIIYKTGDETFDIVKSESGDHKIIKEVIVKKGGEVEKTIEMIVTEDGDHSIVKIIGGEGDLKDIEENVKIYKYKTDDGNITIKAVITDSESGAKKKIKKEYKKIKISPNPTDGKFKLEFELSNKERLAVKVNNESGETVYSKKVKKFKGKFSEEIDISKEEPGTYYILITQGDKTIKQKIEKK